MSKPNYSDYIPIEPPKITGSIPDAPPDPSIKSTRTFPDVINEFTQELLETNRLAMGTEAILLVTRLGLLGQRLIYEANQIGMRDATKMYKKEAHYSVLKADENGNVYDKTTDDSPTNWGADANEFARQSGR